MTSSTVRFGDLLTEPLKNGVYKPKSYHGRGTKVINMKELFAHERVDDHGTDRVHLEPGELDKFRLKTGDLLFARRSFVLEGSGKCSIVGNPSEDTTFESSMIRARLDTTRVLPQFMYYLFTSPIGRGIIGGIATQTAVSGITGKNLQEIRVPVPDVCDQHKIAAILSAYDDLTENNNRRIKVLEEMAQRIYHEWFVEFRYPGYEGLRLVESELGPIPHGWTVAPLSDLAAVVMGQSPPSSAYNRSGAGLPFHQGVGTYGAHFPTHEMFSTAGKRLAEDGDILVSVRAPVGRINLADRQMILGRGVAGVRAQLSPSGFLLQALHHFFREEDVIGGGSIFKSVTRRDMEGVSVIWPGIPLAARFADLVQPLWTELRILTTESTNLRATRDLLLPRLISGELDVSDLDICIPAA